jgi:hypothetical protein
MIPMIDKIYVEICAFVCILCEIEQISMTEIAFNVVQQPEFVLDF